MGRDKALLPWPRATAGRAPSGETLLSEAIRSLSVACDFVVVVVGKNEPSLAPIIYAKGASLVVNPDPGRGQFSSLQTGLQEVLNQGRDAAMVTLVDRPPASEATIRTLHTAFESAAGAIWAVVPEVGGKHGHPYLVGREMIEAFLRAPAMAVARDIEHQHQQHVRYIRVDDPMIAVNVNTPEDYAGLSVPS